jgi:pimeloyl-ACP methyl ester carboxylesterase
VTAYRAPVICLHGLGRSASDWDGVRDALARYGAVHVPELPRASVDALVDGTSALPAPAILVGHSMGGVVALRRAALDPGSVVALVLTGTFFPPALNGRTHMAALADYGAHRLAVARELVARRTRSRPRVRGLRSLADLALRPGELEMTARRLRAPVLVVHARDDHYVPVDFALAAAARNPSWTVEVLDGGGHNAHVERSSEWLGAVLPWLDRTL